MNCTEFTRDIDAAMESPAGRSHVRECSACARAAFERDGLNLFRTLDPSPAIADAEIDSFVGSVMSEIQLRETEKAIEDRRETPRWVGLAMVAAILISISGGLLIHERNLAPAGAPDSVDYAQVTGEVAPLNAPQALPVVDNYSQNDAMIVELPGELADDIRIVMIFDETLPQDL